MRKIFILIIVLFSSTLFANDAVVITGVDNSSLLSEQIVDLYITTENQNLGLEDFIVEESADGSQFNEKQVIEVIAGANKDNGVNFLLLVDNSGSMYDRLDGSATDNPAEMRITVAKQVINDFLSSIENSKDSVALASFNTRTTLLTDSTKNWGIIRDELDGISRPETTEGYTELYASLTDSSPQLGDTGRGRKVVILLSDGENMPFSTYEGNPSPQYGNKLFTPDEAISALKQSGITLYAINFSGVKDPNLGRIASETGGELYDAWNSYQLEQIYNSIRESLLKEYRVSYLAGVYPIEEPMVRVTANSTISEPRTYSAIALFGLPGAISLLILGIALVVLLFIWIILMFVKLEKTRKVPNLELVGNGGLQNKVLNLNQERTIIGGNASHDVTIAGTSIKEDESAATIVFDKKTDSYTIVADKETMVNNKSVKKKKLETGDVIKVGDNLIIFDDERPEKTVIK